MEAIIQVIEGDKFEDTQTCIFCDKSTTIAFGLITDKKYNGHIIKYYGICTEHLEIIESILTGEFNINKLHNKPFNQDIPFLRLRG